MARGASRKGAWKKPREVYYKKQIDKKQAKALSRGIIQYEEHKERVRADRPGYQATKPRITTREGVGFTTASPLIPMKVAKKYGKGLSDGRDVTTSNCHVRNMGCRIRKAETFTKMSALLYTI